MLERTHHDDGPWHVIPADSKKFARVSVVETVNSEIERALVKHGLPVPPRPPSGDP